MSRRREPLLIPPEALRAGELIGRRRFVKTSGGILVVASGLSACTDKLPPLAQLQAPAPDPSQCTVTASPASIAVAGTSTLTLQAKNSSGVNLTTGGDTVVFTATGGTATGTISATTDNSDGTYTATYTGTGAGTAQTIHATIDGVAVTTTLPTVTVTSAAQSPDATKCTVAAAPTSIAVAGTSTLTLQAKDSTGANLTVGGAVVVFTASGGTSTGTISATTDHANGTYTAVYTGTAAGTAQTIHATINGVAVTTASPTVTVTAAAQVPDATKCTVTAFPATITIAGTSVLTLQAKDSSGVNLTVGGATVVFTATGGTSVGTVSATTDLNNGTYTAVYTGTVVGTAQTINATINGVAVTTTLPTVTVSASFVTPDIVNNAGFEGVAPAAWFPFTDWAGSVPPQGVSLASDYAFEGTQSVKIVWSAGNASDGGSQLMCASAVDLDRMWVRIYFRLTAHITTTWKWCRFYTFGFGAPLGGIWIEKDGGGLGGNGLVCVGWDQEDSAIITTIGLTEAQVIDGNWHMLEVDYQRNGGASGFPEAAFWFDGNPQYPELNGHTTVKYYGSGNNSTWVNGRINAGTRGSSSKIRQIEFLATLNANNQTAGQCNLDKIGVSSLGRIGP